MLVLTTAGLAVVSRPSDEASSGVERPPAGTGVVEVQTETRPLLKVPVERLTRPGPLQERRLRALLRRTLPPTFTLARRRARITYRYDAHQTPVRATAARFGVPLHQPPGRSPQEVYDTLLAGHAVMAWVGLSEGPLGQWRSPQGRTVMVNFGEHTVVLYGLRREGRLLVSNPLEGLRELWRKDDFEAMWQRLGRRALAT